MNPINRAASSRLAQISILLQPIEAATSTARHLDAKVLEKAVQGVAKQVIKANNMPPDIYKPVIQALSALLNLETEHCQRCLATLAVTSDKLLRVIIGGPVGQIETVDILMQHTLRIPKRLKVMKHKALKKTALTVATQVVEAGAMPPTIYKPVIQALSALLDSETERCRKRLESVKNVAFP